MFHRYSSMILLIALVLSMASCQFLEQFQNTNSSTSKGEPPAATDTPPPAGYFQFFVKNIQPMPASYAFPSQPSFQVSRHEIEDGTMKMYLHVIDSSGTYFSNLKYKKLWCSVLDVTSVNTDTMDFTVKEVQKSDCPPLALAMVMDHSGSMGEKRARVVQNAAEEFISMKRNKDALALIKYDNAVGVESALTTDGKLLKQRLKKTGLLGYGKTTAVLNGVEAAIKELIKAGPEFEQKAVIVFTDGLDNSSTVNRDSLIALAKQHNITICGVDFGGNIDKNFVSSLAEESGGVYHHIYGTSEFPLVFNDIFNRLTNYYVVEYKPLLFTQHTVKVKLCLPKDTLETSFTYDNTPRAGDVALLNVYFDFDKATIKKESTKAVQGLYHLLMTNPFMTIELQGHTDSKGDDDYNLKLSQKRAEAVRQAIIAQGIDASRITARGFGETKPVASEATAEGAAKNRRTEFVVISQ